MQGWPGFTGKEIAGNPDALSISFVPHDMIRKLSHRVKKGWAEIALLSAEMIIVLIIFLASILAFVFIARNVFVLKNEAFDYKVFSFLESHVTDKKNNIMLFITFLGPIFS